MLKSLYSGISGMKVNQTKLDVTGNNIANVGTTAFKGSRARFQDMLSQSVSGAQGVSPNQGGINGSQIGLGVKLGGIDVNTSQGSMTPTSSVTDLAVDGTGYFVVEKGAQLFDSTTGTTTPTTTQPLVVDSTAASTTDPHGLTADGTTQVYYTRDGSFNRDSQGNLVNSDGYRILGYAVTGDDGTGSGSATSINTTAGQGVADFVDAKSTTLTANDDSLVSLIIPDTVVKTVGGTATNLKVTKVTIDNQGLIVATLEDSSQSVLGQVAMASFNNTTGLKDVGKNLNQATTNSGTPVFKSGIGNTTHDNSKGYGDINSGFLEASNVDLTEQFTDMITTTRAFEANGKTISNGDEILQTIIGLKR